ncbi:6123_t:CDS:2 [Acaulospora morrowiae]|uniref:6123_t:CDS:1 n=1 Tax=Acaulospora morrowiae TaxID=94023 RepID=A0A9N9GS84_9GLOM|nr:6123_t:CDS:2 [Acaulospora morrowiae]
MSSETEVSTSPGNPVRDVNWYRQLWWNTVSQCKDTSISDNTSNYDVSDNAPNPDVTSNASNFDVYQDTKAKSPEDSRSEDVNASKVIDEFLDEVHKKRVSDSIRQRKHEEKL